jgi:hypothetical protein
VIPYGRLTTLLTSLAALDMHLYMSGVLPLAVCRFIALILLVLDLSQEPGSALSFASIGDTDSDTVADLCTEWNFSWAVAACVDSAAPSTRDLVQGSPLFEHRQSYARSVDARCDGTRPAQNFAVLFDATDIPLDTLFSPLGSFWRAESTAHRNTSLAHKREIVLVV